MATVQREAIFVALFTRMEAMLPGIKQFSRIFLGWSNVSKIAQQPAAFLLKGDERIVRNDRGLPPVFELDADILVIATVESNPTVPAGTLLNTWCDAIEALLQRQPDEQVAPGATFAGNPDMMYQTTLGGLCTGVRFAGDISVVEGNAGEQSILHVPLLITAVAAR